jgi:hypothetical protein
MSNTTFMVFLLGGKGLILKFFMPVSIVLSSTLFAGYSRAAPISIGIKKCNEV